jgi:formylglycine-generating enzyme required for sulfatase activity
VIKQGQDSVLGVSPSPGAATDSQDLAGDLTFAYGIGDFKWGTGRSGTSDKLPTGARFLGEAIQEGDLAFGGEGLERIQMKFSRSSLDNIRRGLEERHGSPVIVKNDSRGRVWRWDLDSVTVLIEDVPLLGLSSLKIDRLPSSTAAATRPSTADAEFVRSERVEGAFAGESATERDRLAESMARQLGDFDFKLMGRVKKQSVFLEKGKLCFRTRFFEGTDDKMPIEDYLYEIPLTGIDTDKTELKWNSAWSYGDILVRSREGAEFVRVTTLPSKSSRLKCEKYQHEFEIFGVKNRESLDPLKRLAVLYQEAGVLRSGDGGRETASRDETSPDQTASRPDSFYSIHDFRLNMSWPQVKASVGGTSELKLQKYPEHDDLYVCSLNRSNGNLTFVFHARNQDNLEQSELVCLGLQIDFRSRLSTAEMQNYFNEMIEMKGRPNQVVEGSIPWSLIGGSEVVERGSDDALAAVWGQCEKIGNIDQLEGMDNLQKYCKGKILIQKYSQRDASLMFIDLDRFKRGEGNAGNPVERATEDRDDTVIGEDQVSAGDTSPRSMLIMQAKSYYAMFNMADKNPAMRPSTLDNPMLAMWGGSAENMLKDMIRKCDQYNCPESKRRYEHCLKLCSTWRSNESTLSRPEVRTPATDVGTADVQVEPKAGELRKVDLGNGVSMDFMPIASGSFMMGSENGEDNEKPVHRVTFAQPFWLAKTEVTQAQYQQIMNSNPSEFVGFDLPVETVSWHDAMSFCKKLTERERQAGRLPEGYEYTLPTEAQWEYACRAGTTGDYAGDLDAMAWYYENSGDKRLDDDSWSLVDAAESNSQTHPVGTKRANAWGLYDMHGNVFEWCLDDWHRSYDGAPSDGSQWGDESDSDRVNRGGSWFNGASNCRAASRNWSPMRHECFQGFRPALSSVQGVNRQEER